MGILNIESLAEAIKKVDSSFHESKLAQWRSCLSYSPTIIERIMGDNGPDGEIIHYGMVIVRSSANRNGEIITPINISNSMSVKDSDILPLAMYWHISKRLAKQYGIDYSNAFNVVVSPSSTTSELELKMKAVVDARINLEKRIGKYIQKASSEFIVNTE